MYCWAHVVMLCIIAILPHDYWVYCCGHVCCLCMRACALRLHLRLCTALCCLCLRMHLCLWMVVVVAVDTVASVAVQMPARTLMSLYLYVGMLMKLITPGTSVLIMDLLEQRQHWSHIIKAFGGRERRGGQAQQRYRVPRPTLNRAGLLLGAFLVARAAGEQHSREAPKVPKALQALGLSVPSISFCMTCIHVPSLSTFRCGLRGERIREHMYPTMRMVIPLRNI